MEFRRLARTALSPRPLLPASATSSILPRAALARQFSHSPRFSVDNPLPAATATPDTDATTTTNTTAPTPTKPRMDSLADIFGLAMSAGSAPARQPQSQSLSQRFSMVLPDDLARSGLTNSPPLGAKPTPRTGPSAGRSVPVISDLPQALARLRSILTANNVKVDQLRQRFHERPGKKKKRLKSLRHRRRFKAGFKKLVTIAMEMKRKGL